MTAKDKVSNPLSHLLRNLLLAFVSPWILPIGSNRAESEDLLEPNRGDVLRSDSKATVVVAAWNLEVELA